MRWRKGSSDNSLSVMYLDDLVFSRTVPRWASYSTSPTEEVTFGRDVGLLHMVGREGEGREGEGRDESGN